MMHSKTSFLILVALSLGVAGSATAANRNFLRSDIALKTALLDPAKKTVCTVTINSDDEKKLFQKHLNPKDFQFVELTPELNATKKEEGERDSFGSDQWFDQACKSDVKCDMLVISGHFGGKFVGDKGFSLDLGTIEAHACARDCSGITSDPTEVFLFGCNTLSGKGRDSRSVIEYFQALVEHGWNATDAQAVAEARYGALSQDNRERMRTAFRGVKNIYGFDSIAPAGATVKPLLENYLKSIGNYRAHLDEMNRSTVTGADVILNPVLAKALKPTALTQCTSSPDSPTNCGLFDPEKSRLVRTEFAEELMKRTDRMKYVSSVLNFFETEYVYYAAQPDAAETVVIDRMKANEAAKAEVAKIRNLLDAPSSIISLLRLQARLRWVSDEELEGVHAKIANTLFKLPMSTLSKDTLCGIYEVETGMFSDGVYLEDNEAFQFKSAYLGDLNALAALKCLHLGDDERYVVAALNLMEMKVLSDQSLSVILDTMLGVAGVRPEGVSRADHFQRVMRILQKQKTAGRSKEVMKSLDLEIEQTLAKKKEWKL